MTTLSRRAAATLLALALAACGGASAGTAGGSHGGSGTPSGPPPSPNTRIDGSRVSVWMPPGMIRIPRHAGFVRPDGGIVVSIGDMTAPPGESDAAVEGMLRGLTERGAGSFQPEQSGDTTLYRGRTEGRPAVVRLLVGGEAAGMVLVAHVPGEEALAERIVRSAVIDPTLPLDPRGVLQIQADIPAGLELDTTVGSMMILGEAGVEKPWPPGTVSVVVQYIPLDADAEVTERQLGRMLGASFRRFQPAMESLMGQPVEGGPHEGFDMVVRGFDEGVPLWLRGRVLLERGPDSRPAGALLISAHGRLDREDLLDGIEQLLGSIRL